MIFKNPLDPENIQVKELLKKWLVESSLMKITDSLMVTELECTNVDCPGTETVFTIINEKEEKKIIRLHKPLVFIRNSDILLYCK